MAKRKPRIVQAEIVRLFAVRLRELRVSRGLTQAELAVQARVTIKYVGRLEAGGTAPGIDLVDRLAHALGTSVSDLLPDRAPPDTLATLRTQGQKLFDSLLESAERETWLMLNPLLAKLAESSARR